MVKVGAKVQMSAIAQLLQKFGKGQGKAGKKRGNGKAQGAGSWMLLPAMASTKGKGKASPKQSRFMDKLAKIDASRKVWIGDLSPKTTWKELEKHVEEVTGSKPSITEILPKGRACLAFKTDDEASSAIAIANDTELQGKTIKADVWTHKEKKDNAEEGNKKARKKVAPKNNALLKVAKTLFAKSALGKAKLSKTKKPTRGDAKMQEKLAKVDMDLKIWVGGMKKETTHGQLRKHFAEAGHKPHLINLTGKANACVSFKTADEATAAIPSLNGTELDGSTLEVDVWTKSEKTDKKEKK
jgi:RNA recognition motif-containing protein